MPLLHFLRDNFPSPLMLLIGGPLSLLVSWSALAIAARLRRGRHWKTGYTRKLFHLITFTTVAALMSIPALGMPAVCLFAGMTSLVILHALLRGEGHPHYEALAREKDAPHRTAYIIAPYFATLIGGLITAIAFAPYAVAGFLVTGLGDAVGEPVGARWGRHPYRVLTATATVTHRTLEGSAAVCLVSLLCLILAVALSPALNYTAAMLWQLPVIALLCAAVEAVSPHGWDNLTLQVTPTVCCAWWL